MVIIHSQFSTFREYLDYMPFGTIAWLVAHADVSKTTIVAASHGKAIQAETIERLVRFTGLSRSCFGEESPNNAKTGKRVPVSK